MLDGTYVANMEGGTVHAMFFTALVMCLKKPLM
jgi:hypothetical protein